MSNKFFKNKKTAVVFLIITVLSVLSFVMVSCSKAPSTDNSVMDAKISQAILEQNKDKYLKGEYASESHHIYKTLSEDNKTMYYVQYVYNEYSAKNGKVERVSGGSSPAVITFEENSEKYDFWEPNAGEPYSPEIEEKFPEDIAKNDGTLSENLEKKCDTKAAEHFKK